MIAQPGQPSFPEPPESLLVPAPAATLRDGLAWLGHGCLDGCAAATQGLDALPAATCFVRRGAHRRAGFAGRIVVDARASGLPHDTARQLVAAVDACARADGIVVRLRPGPGASREAER